MGASRESLHADLATASAKGSLSESESVVANSFAKGGSMPTARSPTLGVKVTYRGTPSDHAARLSVQTEEHAQDLWNNLVFGDFPAIFVCGLFARRTTPFARFLFLLADRSRFFPLSPQGAIPVVEGPYRPPCDLPFPAVLVRRGPHFGAPQKSCQRLKSRKLAQNLVNAMFAYFSWLCLGCPDVGSKALLAYGTDPLMTSGVQASAESLLQEVLRFVRQPGALHGPLGGGRARVTQELQACLKQHYGLAAPSALTGGAQSVDLERVDLPTVGGTVAIENLLTEDQRRVYSNVDALVLPPELWPDTPKPCHRVSPEDEEALQDHLLSNQMAGLMLASELPKRADVSPLVGGFFAVDEPKKVSPKSGQQIQAQLPNKQRLIFDRRPQNSTERRILWVRLPCAAQLRRKLLQPSEVWRGSGKDLRNFYFRLSHCKQWWARHGAGTYVKRRLKAKWLASHYVGSGVPSVSKQCCLVLRVAGMGDHNTVDIATTCHINSLENRKLLPMSERLRHGYPVPRGSLWSGVYIDDFLLLLSVRRRFAKTRAKDTERAEAVSEAYVEDDLEEETSKTFHQELNFKSWGAEVLGGLGRVGAPAEVRMQLFRVCVCVLAVGWANQHILQSILGLFASVFIFRRECFSIFHHAYTYVSEMSADKWVPLPSFLLDELRAAALVLPTCTANIRAPMSESALATDATPVAGGSTIVQLPSTLAETLYEVAEQRGASLRLDGKWTKAGMGAERLTQRSAGMDALVKSLDWRVLDSYRFRKAGHINLQEARAVRVEVVREARRSLQPRRVILFCDSQVVVGALGKGRSSSYKLNGILRSMLPYFIGANLELVVIWVSTHCNPADFPSRFLPLSPTHGYDRRSAQIFRSCLG